MTRGKRSVVRENGKSKRENGRQEKDNAETLRAQRGAERLGERLQVMVEDIEAREPHTPGHLHEYQKKGVAGGAFRNCMKTKGTESRE